MKDYQNIQIILQKYIDNTIEQTEYEQLLQFFGQDADEEKVAPYIKEALQSNNIEDIDRNMLTKAVGRIDEKIHEQILTEKPKISFISKLYPYAAAVFFAALFGLAIYQLRENSEQQNKANQIVDALPGSNRATLTFDGGNTIDLNSTKSGIVVDNNITYSDGTSVLSGTKQTITDTKQEVAITYATLQTPRGGQYRITLPDGTKVTLNAETSLRYPSQFTGNTRNVELHGEAFFDVAHNANQPFIVKGDRQEVKVRGTTFNITDYAGTPIATTLLTGSIELRLPTDTQPIVLHPGQQTLVENNSVRIQQVQSGDYTAWTRNLFVFNDVPLSNILKQLERWYDIEVVYPAHFQEQHFYAEIPRNRKLSEVLRNLERSGNFKFEQQGRRVIVRQ